MSIINELLKPANGYQARVPIRWSWKEGWEITMFLMPLRQPGKPELSNINKTKFLLPIMNNKGQHISSGMYYTIALQNCSIYTFAMDFERLKMGEWIEQATIGMTNGDCIIKLIALCGS